MGLDDKIKNAAQDAAGNAKEKIGNATDNNKLASEGAADQAEAKVNKAAENVKDDLK
ncbi:CsbD family protein [Microbacterium oxydans]|uniref:CsbD family protein n=1 Tax=Microbacterium TaxID=33882 RepID=UPI00259A55E4|nr:CsbD family protein [uncultured Microbacterium sp.]